MGWGSLPLWLRLSRTTILLLTNVLPPFAVQTRSSADWYAAANPQTAYNTLWFEYIDALKDYLDSLGYLDKAYHYMANEPQDQADYDAVAWYAQELKKAAPGLRLMVSEEPKPEIYNHPLLYRCQT